MSNTTGGFTVFLQKFLCASVGLFESKLERGYSYSYEKNYTSPATADVYSFVTVGKNAEGRIGQFGINILSTHDERSAKSRHKSFANMTYKILFSN